MKYFLWLIIAFTFVCENNYSQYNEMKFTNLDRQDGLSGNLVFCIFQDSRYFLWFGTDAGLDRFDGYNFKTFKTEFGDSLSLSGNNVKAIAEDNNHNLWIGTETGLCKLDITTEKFTRYPSVPEDTTTLSYDYISSLKFHQSGKIYIGTAGRGLCCYNSESDNFTRISFINHTDVELGKVISDLICLPDGRLGILVNGHKLIIVNPENWIVDKVTILPFIQWGGIKRLFSYRDKIYVGAGAVIYTLDIKDYSLQQISLPANFKDVQGLITGIDIDSKGIIWIGSSNQGVFLFDPEKGEIIKNINHDEFNVSSISGPDISSIFIDKSNKVWIGTWSSGVNYYHPDIYKFELLSSLQYYQKNLPSNKINAICHDGSNKVWIGTEKGLASFRVSEMSYNSVGSSIESLNSKSVLSLYCDANQNIWVGCYSGGLKKLNANTGTIKDIALFKSGISIKKITEVKPGILWLSTLGNGIVEYNTVSGENNHVLENKISSYFTSDLVVDIDNNVWIGSVYGLNRYNLTTDKIEKYFNVPKDPSSLASNHIHCIRQLSDGHIIIGTSSGLNIYKKKTNSFFTINSKNDLQDDYICGIEEDNQKRIWVSTLKGLTCISIKSYEPFEYSLINYSGYDGLQSSGFRVLASDKLSSGMLLFGGNKGLNFFFPDKISVDNSEPLAIITSFQLNNQEIKVNEQYNGHVILSKAIGETKKVTLKHYENILSFEFAALNAVIPEKCLFKYKLDGLEQKWNIALSGSHMISYTNLDPGDYVLKIKASNSDGIWGEEGARLKIKILPPIWKTKGAIIAYILLVLASLIILRQIIIGAERKRTEEKLAVQEAQQLHEMDMLKIKFFTNVSHEFRTPLTLIITPIEKIIKEHKYKELEQPLQIVYRNSRRLLNLVNQLLDFRKMEVSGLKLSPTTGDIIEFLKEMVVSFTDLAERKKISFKFRSNIKELIIQFDHDKMEKIIFNLLSNAFKYTLEKGEIIVEVDLIEQINLVSGNHINHSGAGKELRVKVSDTGIGISHDKLEHIFERFMQIDKTNKIVEHGSGIGLSLTREFVKMHGGTIWAESEEDKGSCFTFKIPLENIVVKTNTADQNFYFENRVEAAEEAENKENLPVVLLVEDNEDLRFYLRDNLKKNYRILEAGDGKVAMKTAIAEMPDLIISDIMMPELDGIELCKQLKSHQNTSHIPVILLTAKISEEQKLAGYEGGADAYITKPFSFEILETRIKNLIKQRKKLKNLFNKKIEINPSEISVTSVDEKLIRKALDVVEKNISNADFSVELLGRELGMSRVHLYKKLLSITGKSPIEFIRVIRLKRAAQLLQKSQLRVSEIAYEVGFNNPKYFSKYFKEEFNMLPSEYATRYESGNNDQSD